jgi:hypothetical protein
MKRLIVLALAAAALAVPAAQAAPPKGPTMAQFNALKAQLAKDEKAIKDLEGGLSAAFDFMACQNAVTADAFQATWAQDDAFATSLGKPAVYGVQTPIGDANGCANWKNPIVRMHAMPHNTSVFSALAALLTG